MEAYLEAAGCCRTSSTELGTVEARGISSERNQAGASLSVVRLHLTPRKGIGSKGYSTGPDRGLGVGEILAGEAPSKHGGQGALNLLDLLKPGGLIAFTSSSEVYGDALVSPQPETYRGYVDCTGPRSSYDESKRCVESLLFEARRVHGVRVKVVRLFNVFGPRTRVDDGRAVSNFITQGLRGLPITVYGDGSQTRSWTYIDDVIDALGRFFWSDGSEFAGPLNIGADREVPVIEVAKYVQRCFPGSRLEFQPPPPQDPTNRRPDLRLARQMLPGWSADVTYEQGVERTIDWFRRRLAGQRAGVGLEASA